MVGLIIAAFACASISFTICITSIFKEVREIISLAHPKLEELIHCPWCLGHYIVLGYVLLLKPYESPEGFLISWFSIVGMMGCIHYVLLRAYEPVAKMMIRRKMEKLNQES